VNEKTEAETRATKAENDLASASASKLPPGHVAVKKADADLLTSYKTLGTPDELTTVKSEHETFKAEVETAKREKHLRSVAEVLGYQPDAFALLPSLPEFEIRDSSEKDAKGQPKKTVVAKVKDAAGVVTEKPAKEYIEGSDAYRPLLPALQAKSEGGGVAYVPQSAGGGGVKANEFDEIRSQMETAKKTAQPKDNASVLAALGGQRSAAAN
jgi:hypothetical protein